MRVYHIIYHCSDQHHAYFMFGASIYTYLARPIEVFCIIISPSTRKKLVSHPCLVCSENLMLYNYNHHTAVFSDRMVEREGVVAQKLAATLKQL